MGILVYDEYPCIGLSPEGLGWQQNVHRLVPRTHKPLGDLERVLHSAKLQARCFSAPLQAPPVTLASFCFASIPPILHSPPSGLLGPPSVSKASAFVATSTSALCYRETASPHRTAPESLFFSLPPPPHPAPQPSLKAQGRSPFLRRPIPLLPTRDSNCMVKANRCLLKLNSPLTAPVVKRQGLDCGTPPESGGWGARHSSLSSGGPMD